MKFTKLDPVADREAAHRIWHEIGWADISEKDEMASVDLQLEYCDGLTHRVDGAAECIVLIAPGSMVYLKETLPLSAVMAVTVSHIMRKQGVAGRMTAQAIAQGAAQGAAVSGLGMFEQGFYNRLGFGTASYEHLISFDPQRLTLNSARRPPVRVTKADWEAVHRARCQRMPHHGMVNFDSPLVTKARMAETTKGFGLGFLDDDGQLGPHFWCMPTDLDYGPIQVDWLVYRNYDELLEVLGLIKNLGDQIRMVRLHEPPGIQFQDLVSAPVHDWILTKQSRFPYNTETIADGQIRICDMEACLEKTHLRCDESRFNLTLTDGIADFLPEDTPWRGVAGEYIITIGKECAAEKGSDSSLPRLSASVNAFTRMWLGVRPASALAATDTLSGPAELVEELDWAFRLPTPMRDWDY